MSKRTRDNPPAQPGATITAPLGEFGDGAQWGYPGQRIRRDKVGLNGDLSPAQSRVLRAIYAGLRGEHATLSNGTHVESAIDAVRWMLEHATEHRAAVRGPEPAVKQG